MQPLVSWWFPYCPLFLSFQVGILLAKEENNSLRQEKQMLKKKLEEVRKRVVWEDLVTVTECGHAGLVARAWLEGLQANAAGHCTTTGTAPLPGPEAPVVSLGLQAQLDPSRDSAEVLQLFILSHELVCSVRIGRDSPCAGSGLLQVLSVYLNLDAAGFAREENGV